MHHRWGFVHVSWRTCRPLGKLFTAVLLVLITGALPAPLAAAAPQCSYAHLTDLKNFGDNPGRLKEAGARAQRLNLARRAVRRREPVDDPSGRLIGRVGMLILCRHTHTIVSKPT